MFKTVFLVDQDEAAKTYTARGVSAVTGKRVTNKAAQKVATEIMLKSHPLYYNAYPFVWSQGCINLPKTNEFYWIPEYEKNITIDVVLPPDPKMHDWVVLFYNLTSVAGEVTMEDPLRMKLISKHRLMGLDEPMLCDIPFSSLRLTFVGDIDGWIVT